MTAGSWLALLGSVAGLSLLSVGGAITVAPEMRRLLVDRLGLLGEAQFGTSIALAQASPGPNALYVAVLGYQAAGLAGALATLAAFLAPTTALALAVGRWSAAGDAPAVRALKAGLAPVAIAMLVATSWLLAARAPGPAPVAVTAAAALLVWRTRLHLLWMIAAGALLGGLGLL